ncbi:hypothetical protein [Candidatus Poriferisodalis sp.]|uniref:hypothetical protein n=1 Tax=Candidatus Poriferisodalis sp. TaxID=3101277 RepID=UPI003B0208FC
MDDDGLIEVSTLAQLNAMRWDPDGNGYAYLLDPYAVAFPDAMNGMGCPSSWCSGYELANDLDFDTNGNGEADAGDAYWNGGAGLASRGRCLLEVRLGLPRFRPVYRRVRRQRQRDPQSLHQPGPRRRGAGGATARMKIRVCSARPGE